MRTIVPIDISPSNWITVYLQVGLPQPSVAGPGHLTVKQFFTDRPPLAFTSCIASSMPERHPALQDYLVELFKRSEERRVG